MCVCVIRSTDGISKLLIGLTTKIISLLLMLFKCRSIERRESLTYMLRRFMALFVVVE